MVWHSPDRPTIKGNPTNNTAEGKNGLTQPQQTYRQGKPQTWWASRGPGRWRWTPPCGSCTALPGTWCSWPGAGCTSGGWSASTHTTSMSVVGANASLLVLFSLFLVLFSLLHHYSLCVCVCVCFRIMLYVNSFGRTVLYMCTIPVFFSLHISTIALPSFFDRKTAQNSKNKPENLRWTFFWLHCSDCLELAADRPESLSLPPNFQS